MSLFNKLLLITVLSPIAVPIAVFGQTLLLQSHSAAPSTESATQGIGHRMFDPNGLRGDRHVWLNAEVLYWQASEDDLQYALKSDTTTGMGNGTVESCDFDFDFGFRLGLGWKFPHYDRWDLFFNYTYLEALAHGSTSAPAGGAIFPQFSTPALAGTYVAQAKMHWNAHLNIADVELGRNCFAGKWLSFRPFMGVRAAFIEQMAHVTYEGGTGVPVGDEDKLKLRNDFWGVGLRMGFNSLWGLGGGWGLYGNGAASLLSGDFTVREREQLEKAGTVRLQLNADTENVVAIAELGLGVQWDYLFSQGRYHFGVKLGWEFDAFFGQNQLVRFLGSSPGSISRSDGDLTFQGVSCGLRFDF